jgi:hypothetical protein
MRVKSLGCLTASLTVTAAAPALAAPPANDNFVDAQRVGIGVEYTGSNLEATRELGEPHHAGWHPVRSVWFRYRAPRSGPLTIDSSGSDPITILAVYTGSQLSNLKAVGSDYDGTPDGNGVVRFKARRHRVYRIAIDTIFNDGAGIYKLWLSDGGIKGKGVAMSVDPGQTVNDAIAHGLHLNVSARRRVGTSLSLRVAHRTARRLGLKSRVLGRAGGSVDYGQTLRATIPLTHAARVALDGVRHLRARVRLTLPRSKSPDKVLTIGVHL